MTTTLTGLGARAGYTRLERATPSRAAVYTGRGLTGFIGLFLLFDGAARTVGFAPYVDGLAVAGYPVSLAVPIGVALIVSTVLYLVPRTAVLGALLITGYLGGAVATHVRMEDPWFLSPVVFAAIAWAGLLLRRPRLRAALLRGR